MKYEKHHGVRLTAAGKMRALEVLRHHRLLERFLHDFLDYSWDEVHDEAERLEHFISERLEDRIAAKLGDPETDPHGHLIPERNGALPAREEVPAVEMGLRRPSRDQQRVRSRCRGLARDDPSGIEARRGDHGGSGHTQRFAAGPNRRPAGCCSVEPGLSPPESG